LRLARSVRNDAYDEEGAGQYRRRSSYDRDDGGYRPRYTKRRHARPVRHARRHHRAAHRRHAGRRTAAQHRSRAAQLRAQRRHAAAAPSKRRPAAAPKGSASHGVASFYWQPQRVASGGWFNPNAMTAAHKTLPFGTNVRVTHLGNGRSVDVRINDRGPYIAGRIIDLSKAAASILGMTAQGIARVKVEVLGR
jgi:rare lipoprotein A